MEQCAASQNQTISAKSLLLTAPRRLVQNHMQKDGRICITADGNIEPLVLTPAFHEKELQIVGSSDGWDYHEHAAWYFHEVLRRPTLLEQLFEIEVASKELITVFEQLATGTIQPIKVLVHYTP